MSSRRMTGEDRKLAIVRAALPLFARKGFAETTIKDLARAAGVSEPLLYKHFPSKDALYLEIQDLCCRDIDPFVKRLTDLKPSAASLVQMLYGLMRALVLGKPTGVIDWDMKHRLMLNSLLDDGRYARLQYKNRFDQFCAQMEASLEAAIANREAVATGIARGNRARFAHHVGAWLALVHLPGKAAIDYKTSRAELLDQIVRFALRGMGLTDRAIARHFQPEKLAASFDAD